MSAVSRFLPFLQVSIFAGALFIQLSLGWDMYISIAALLAVTGVYTVLGGCISVVVSVFL